GNHRRYGFHCFRNGFYFVESGVQKFRAALQEKTIQEHKKRLASSQGAPPFMNRSPILIGADAACSKGNSLQDHRPDNVRDIQLALPGSDIAAELRVELAELGWIDEIISTHAEGVGDDHLLPNVGHDAFVV